MGARSARKLAWFTAPEKTARPGEKSMQFGRFHGIALLALGALLLFVQSVVIFKGTAPPGEAASSAQQAPVTPPGRPALPAWDYLSGVLGIVLASAGAYALARASHKGELERMEEERRQEDPSFGREGHQVSTPTIWKER